ncbi:MAG TPA: hypothetical protein VE130_10090 [Nitrososphaeraceae archaeon]|nr:hypothetical protein [Nitrososphaeraceae archaeon]
MMSQQKQQLLLLNQELTIPQILRTYGKQFVQIRKQYSDGHHGRCALGVIMSYFGWNGKDDSNAPKQLLDVLVALGRESISEKLIIPGCQNTDSQIQGDENGVAQTAQQTFPEVDNGYHGGHDGKRGDDDDAPRF